jgi:hypothetical protein
VSVDVELSSRLGNVIAIAGVGIPERKLEVNRRLFDLHVLLHDQARAKRRSWIILSN